jgi:uncharacterized protein YeaO (DUF488 family)
MNDLTAILELVRDPKKAEKQIKMLQKRERSAIDAERAASIIRKSARERVEQAEVMVEAIRKREKAIDDREKKIDSEIAAKIKNGEKRAEQEFQSFMRKYEAEMDSKTKHLAKMNAVYERSAIAHNDKVAAIKRRLVSIRKAIDEYC